MNILFLFFPFFRNKKYNPPILIHRNRLNFTKVLIILRFRLEEYFIVFRHEFLFFCCVSTIFNHYFLSISAKMLWFLYRLSLFRPSTFSRQLIFFIASFELEKMKLFSSRVSIVWYGFCTQRRSNRNARTQTPLALLILLLYLFLSPPLLDRREK